MIAAMKKVQVLAMKSRRRQVTDALAELGTIHIETRDAESPDLDQLKEQGSLLQRALTAIPATAESADDLKAQSLDEAVEMARHVLSKSAELKEAEEQVEKIRREINRVKDWGDFAPASLQSIQNSGVYLSLATATLDQMKRIPEELRYILVRKTKDKRYLLLLDDPQDADLDSFRVPERSLTELQQELSKAGERSKLLRAQIMGMQPERRAIEAALDLHASAFEFASVEASLEELTDLEQICEISGFIPKTDTDALKTFAANEGLGLILQDPGADDPVPTKVENPRAVGIIKPVFQFMGTTPGYREQDISFWFLIFFTLFFAMIIGDAGYGAILTIASLFMTIKAKIKNGRVPDGLILFNVLSIATVAWGAVTGNWFGYGPIADLPVLSSLVVPALDSFAVENSAAVTQMIQFLCFAIALVHLILAHTLAFLKKIKESPRIHAFADLGWMSAIVGLFFLVLNVVISVEEYPVPSWAIYLIGSGVAVVFLFSGQEGDGFLKGVIRALSDFINIALSGVSAFADVISYIRLFAVGLASIEIAKSFNGMAEGMMESGVGGIVGGVFVLLLGHTLNLVMGALSVVVHGIRLKMLEFSSHLGNEWAGFEYKPFKQ